jgi:hypothetical protein
VAVFVAVGVDVFVKVAEGVTGVNVLVAVKVAVLVGVYVNVEVNVSGWKGVNETVALGVIVSVGVLVMVNVGVMVLVKTRGVALTVGEGNVPVSVMVGVTVGVVRVSGARERAMKPIQ